MAPWYFAYGSNLLIRQMIERTGSIGDFEHPPRLARLANHRLVFQHLEPTGPAFANILSPGDGVIGVVYRCRPEDLTKLDYYESGYERQLVEVIDQDGEVLAATAYVIRPGPGVKPGRPSAEYLERIVTGARQHGIPSPYIDSICATAHAEASLRDWCLEK